MAIKDMLDSDPAKKARPGAAAANAQQEPRQGDKPT